MLWHTTSLTSQITHELLHLWSRWSEWEAGTNTAHISASFFVQLFFCLSRQGKTSHEECSWHIIIACILYLSSRLNTRAQVWYSVLWVMPCVIYVMDTTDLHCFILHICYRVHAIPVIEPMTYAIQYIEPFGNLISTFGQPSVTLQFCRMKRKHIWSITETHLNTSDGI